MSSPSPFKIIADTLGLTFEPSRGLTFAPRVHGVLDGRPVRCTWGDQGARIEGLLEPPLDFGLHIATKNVTPSLDFGSRIVLGDSSWDDELHATADEPGRAGAAMTPDVRAAVLLLNAENAGITITDEKITAAALQYDVQASIRALRKVVNVARVLDEARSAAAPPASITPLVAACKAFAAECSLSFANTPCRVNGTLRDVALSLAFRRTGKARFTLGLRAAPVAAPHGFGLVVRPESTLDRVRTFFGAQDVHTGDPTFDPAFLVQAAEEERARSALDPDVRALLLDLRRHFEKVTLHDATLTLETPAAPLRPEDLAPTIEMACTIVSSVERASAATPRGPYR